MARTAITVNDSSKAGTVLPGTEPPSDVANGNSIANDGRVMLLLHNTGAVTRNLTLALVGTIDGFAPTARTIPVAAGVYKLSGPFETVNYGVSLAANGDNAELKIIPIRAAA